MTVPPRTTGFFLRCSLLVMALVALGFPEPAGAQYFGQNKVQYEHFDFEVLRTATFDIYHYPEEAEAVKKAARLAEEWRERLTRDLGFELAGRQPLVLYASHPHFRQTQVIGGLIGEGTGGVTESLKRRMAMPFASTLGETSHVLGHELVHAFQYGAGGERAGALPLWFIEGMAEYLSIGAEHPQTAMWLRDLARQEEIPGFEDLANPRYFPYRLGHAAWAYLASRFGSSVVGNAYLEGARTGDAIAALQNVTGISIEELSEGWRSAIRRQYSTGDDAAPAGRLAVGGDGGRDGSLNVSPALSPDGRWLAYLSERDLFSIDLYVADAATGRIVRRLTKTATEPHIESLQFAASAGAWDPTSRRFAFTTIDSGRAMLSIAEVGEGGGGRRDHPLPSVDEAWHPAWAPDGRSVVFSGLTGGFADLYVVDLEGGAVRRLTNDAYADLQPSWSPDGRRVAFVTDRFSSSVDALAFGPPRLALLTVATGDITPLPALGEGDPPQSPVERRW